MHHRGSLPIDSPRFWRLIHSKTHEHTSPKGLIPPLIKKIVRTAFFHTWRNFRVHLRGLVSALSLGSSGTRSAHFGLFIFILLAIYGHTGEHFCIAIAKNVCRRERHHLVVGITNRHLAQSKLSNLLWYFHRSVAPFCRSPSVWFDLHPSHFEGTSFHGFTVRIE